MNFIFILGIAAALAMDAFAVSIGVSLRPGGINSRQAFRLSLHFGFFQFLMPLLGWAAGRTLLSFIQAIDHWVAFVLLAVVGFKMIREAFFGGEEGRGGNDPTKGWALLVLAIATSVDALAVGLSLAVLETGILFPAAVIGLVAFGLSLVGTRLGPLIGRIAGRWAEAAGGFILLLIGIKILVEHL